MKRAKSGAPRFERVADWVQEAFEKGNCQDARSNLTDMGQEVSRVAHDSEVSDDEVLRAEGLFESLHQHLRRTCPNVPPIRASEVSTAEFDGLSGLAGLGDPADHHVERRNEAVEAVVNVTSEGLEALQQRDCDIAFTRLLGAKEMLGSARAHGYSANEERDTEDMLVPGRQQFLQLLNGFEKKCLVKRKR